MAHRLIKTLGMALVILAVVITGGHFDQSLSVSRALSSITNGNLIVSSPLFVKKKTVKNVVYNLYDNYTALITDSESKKTTITVPSRIDGYTVTGLNSDAFKGNKTMTSIVLPTSIKLIKADAFKSSKLKNVYYRGTKKAWKKITIEEGNNVLSKASKKYNCNEQLNKTSTTIYKGRSKTLSILYRIDTDKAKWSSSNKKIATVSQKGTVKAKKKGTVKITAKISEKRRYTCTVKVKDSVCIKLKTVSQHKNGYPKGCEAVSLYMCMRGKGYLKNMSLKAFVSTMPTGINPNYGYMGDPTGQTSNYGKRTTIYPTPLAAWGSQYGKVESMEGASIDKLKKALEKGNPLVVYMTSGMRDPIWKNYYWGKDIRNHHALCLVGYTSKGDFIVNDCGRRCKQYKVPKKRFKTIYNLRKKAVVVK